MKISNRQFGEIEFTEDKILYFDGGLFGFEELKNYLLIRTENELFFWLCSIDQPEVIFPLIGLRLIDESYPQSESHEAFGIVRLNPDANKITVNLKAPVYLDQENKKGFQTIIDKDSYPVDYKLFID